MYWKDIVQLLTITETTDDEGYKNREELPRAVFANAKSATRAEFYTAKQAGDSITLVLEIRGADYQGETRLTFRDKPYDVVRVFSRAGDIVELSCKESSLFAGGGEGA